MDHHVSRKCDAKKINQTYCEKEREREGDMARKSARVRERERLKVEGNGVAREGTEWDRESARARVRERENVRANARVRGRASERARDGERRTGEPRATNAAYTRRARPTIRKNTCMSDGDEGKREIETRRGEAAWKAERGNLRAKNNV